MAHQSLAVFSRLPFPETFSKVIQQELDRVDQVVSCSYQAPESSWGACDGGQPCLAQATVRDPETGLEFCATHFDQAQAVTRPSDTPALQQQDPGNTLPKNERYFAIVIKADDRFGGLLNASTNLGNYLRACEHLVLPEGAKITRAIEITKDMATRTW